MRRFFFALCVGAAGLAQLGLGPARAQVVVHQAALDQLAGIAPATVPVSMPPVHRKHFRRQTKMIARARIVPAVVVPVVVKPAPGSPFVPAAPKKKVVQVAVARPAPPVPAEPGAVVLRFAAGDDALPGDATDSLRPICAAGKSAGLVVVDAYAPADNADPSAAMRLSLSRAFAVRDALAACGVPPAHIVPRADGAAGDATSARITIGKGAGN